MESTEGQKHTWLANRISNKVKIVKLPFVDHRVWKRSHWGHQNAFFDNGQWDMRSSNSEKHCAHLKPACVYDNSKLLTILFFLLTLKANNKSIAFGSTKFIKLKTGSTGLSPEIGTFGRKYYLGTISYRVFGKLNKSSNALPFLQRHNSLD